MSPAVTAQHLVKTFNGVPAVDDVTFELELGEVVGFLGPNGAGKSTTLRLLLGLLRPDAGEARILDFAAGSPEARARVAYVPGDVNLWPQLTGREAIALLTSLHGGEDGPYRDELLERFELDPEKRVRAYSKGNRQKVAIIAALATRAPVLLLDEPTSGLDPLMERVFRECVLEARNRGQAVLLSSHIISEVEHVCSRVVMIRAGRLVSTSAIDELRQHVGVEIEVVGTTPDLTGVPGVVAVVPTEDGVRVRVNGPVAPLLSALARGQVTSLRTREASLEEIFLSYYDGAEPT